MEKFVIGVDFGTDSCRAILVNAMSGEVVSSAVHNFVRWQEQYYCNSELFQYRQHPLDHLEGLEKSITKVLLSVGKEIKKKIVSIGVDATGSTPGPVDKNGTQLALLPEFSNEPDAMFILWKDHTAILEAKEINKLSKLWKEDYTRFSGGYYSAEWYWSKILHIVRKNKKIKEAAYTWVEHSDWLPAILTGNTKPENLIRNRCAAGHKGLWHASFSNGYPDEQFFHELDSELVRVLRTFHGEPLAVDSAVGTLSPEWADKLGLSQNILVATGIIDAHCGAIGANIKANTMVKVMGTSTCDMVIAKPESVKDILVDGISGQVDGSILPHYIGFEAGQSAFGDIYTWYAQLLSWPLQYFKDAISFKQDRFKLLPALDAEAAKIQITENLNYAVDWFNGRRTPDANQNVYAGVGGLSLASDAVSFYYALVESSVFGSFAILNRFEEEGVAIENIIATGGIAKKSPFVMQLMADVFNRNILVAKEIQTVAIGAAMIASTIAKIYPNIEKVQEAWFSGYECIYTPNNERHKVLMKRWQKYQQFTHFLNNL